MNEDIGLDMGAGNFKLFCNAGGIVLASQAAMAGEVMTASVEGLRSETPPLRIRTNGHQYYVGLGSHSWGRPAENLDDTRFAAGSPELYALTLAIFEHKARTYGQETRDATVWVGLPQSANGRDTAASLRGWLRGEHRYWAAWDGKDEVERVVTIEEVGATSQIVGALYDAILDDHGQFTADGKALYKKEVVIISIGMSTLEMAVIECGHINHHFTMSETSGVRRLLDLVDPQALYSRGELDTKFREGRLDVGNAMQAWESEIVGKIENKLGKARRRFAAALCVGWGVVPLQNTLTMLFSGKTRYTNDPVMAIARGLHKWGLLKDSRKRG
ncbi:MAG: ParM/StbA family protein [Anaerolineae bacterium]|nr:ParM/StbA family protein [Anaerolineae bacterium]